MKDVARLERMPFDPDRPIADVVRREQSRLRQFIRRRVPDPRDVEDILQDVFFELVEANRLLMPIEHVTGWLFRVARNRIVDLFRRRTAERIGDPVAPAGLDDEAERVRWEELLPSPDSGPDALYARRILLDAVAEAIDELPDEQRDVFVAHEIDGRTFRDLAAGTGTNVNTLLSRKRYAVRHLRARLQRAYDDFTSRGLR